MGAAPEGEDLTPLGIVRVDICPVLTDEQEFATCVGQPLWGGTVLSRDPLKEGSRVDGDMVWGSGQVSDEQPILRRATDGRCL